MRRPSNRGERKAAQDKFRRRSAERESYDRKDKERGPDFNPTDLDRKAVKQRQKAWNMVAKLLPPGATELTPNELYFGGVAAGADKYIKF